mmetsp:Transcript_16551/g.57869  ORF Transcript_16551/g.57869 Transcript_16551/m.57869 type:complete len:345 (+) Transcript_16551:423-1457(+)
MRRYDAAARSTSEASTHSTPRVYSAACVSTYSRATVDLPTPPSPATACVTATRPPVNRGVVGGVDTAAPPAPPAAPPEPAAPPSLPSPPSSSEPHSRDATAATRASTPTSVAGRAGITPAPGYGTRLVDINADMVPDLNAATMASTAASPTPLSSQSRRNAASASRSASSLCDALSERPSSATRSSSASSASSDARSCAVAAPPPAASSRIASATTALATVTTASAAAAKSAADSVWHQSCAVVLRSRLAACNAATTGLPPSRACSHVQNLRTLSSSETSASAGDDRAACAASDGRPVRPTMASAQRYASSTASAPAPSRLAAQKVRRAACIRSCWRKAAALPV